MTKNKSTDEPETIKDDKSPLHTDTNAGPDAKQGTVADQNAEGTAPARNASE